MPGVYYGWPKNVLHHAGIAPVDPGHQRRGAAPPGDRQRHRRHGGGRPDHGDAEARGRPGDGDEPAGRGRDLCPADEDRSARGSNTWRRPRAGSARSPSTSIEQRGEPIAALAQVRSGCSITPPLRRSARERTPRPAPISCPRGGSHSLGRASALRIESRHRRRVSPRHPRRRTAFRIRREEADQPDGKRQLLVGDPGSPVLAGGRCRNPDRSDPPAIGRYRVIRRLGQGGFGRVYLARDDDLDRSVAIKVPNPERIAGPGDVEAYLAEARRLAKLDHPHIVPVYDVGRTADGLCFVVSKYIDGSDLAERIAAGPAVVPRGGGAGGGRRRGAAPRAHAGPGPPRRQAREHPDRRDPVALGGRFRPGAQGRGLRQGGPARRHALLHEPRAGPRRGAPGRTAARTSSAWAWCSTSC